jgi:hypothetical protein
MRKIPKPNRAGVTFYRNGHTSVSYRAAFSVKARPQSLAQINFRIWGPDIVEWLKEAATWRRRLAEAKAGTSAYTVDDCRREHAYALRALRDAVASRERNLVKLREMRTPRPW